MSPSQAGRSGECLRGVDHCMGSALVAGPEPRQGLTLEGPPRFTLHHGPSPSQSPPKPDCARHGGGNSAHRHRGGQRRPDVREPPGPGGGSLLHACQPLGGERSRCATRCGARRRARPFQRVPPGGCRPRLCDRWCMSSRRLGGSRSVGSDSGGRASRSGRPLVEGTRPSFVPRSTAFATASSLTRKHMG